MAQAASGGYGSNENDDVSSVCRAIVAGESAARVRELIEQYASAGGAQAHSSDAYDAWRSATVEYKSSDDGGETPLQAAHRLRRGDLVGTLLEGALRELLRAGYDANERLPLAIGGTLDGSDYDGYAFSRPVHLAVIPPRRCPDSWGLPPQLNCVRILVEDGRADINGLDCERCTPLHWLANLPTDFDRGLDVLLELGADIEARNKYGQTPIFMAANHINIEPVQALLSRGASPDVSDVIGATPLLRACRHTSRWPEVVELLLPLSSVERTTTRRAVDERGFSAIDDIFQDNSFFLNNELTPSQHAIITELLRSGTPVHLSSATGVLRVAAQLGSTLGAETDARGISPKTIWRAQEAMVGLASDSYDARAAEQGVAERERRVHELEEGLRALGVGTEDTDESGEDLGGDESGKSDDNDKSGEASEAGSY